MTTQLFGESQMAGSIIGMFLDLRLGPGENQSVLKIRCQGGVC
jgi:hypothetical protein